MLDLAAGPTGEVVCKGRHAQLRTDGPRRHPAFGLLVLFPGWKPPRATARRERARGPSRLPAPRPDSTGRRSDRSPPGPPGARVSLGCGVQRFGTRASPWLVSSPGSFCPAGPDVCDDQKITRVTSALAAVRRVFHLVKEHRSAEADQAALTASALNQARRSLQGGRQFVDNAVENRCTACRGVGTTGGQSRSIQGVTLCNVMVLPGPSLGDSG